MHVKGAQEGDGIKRFKDILYVMPKCQRESMIVDYAEDGEVVYGKATDLYGKCPKRPKTYSAHSRHDLRAIPPLFSLTHNN